MKKIILSLIMIFVALFTINVKAEYVADKSHSILKRGDIIYFDTTGLDWQHVFIHIWEKNGDTYKAWSSNDEMTKVEGTDNIYMFTVPNDIDEKYNMIIFHSENGGSQNQTISLGYIEEKFAYKVTDYSDGKRVGYWYLYDKSDLQTRLTNLKVYQTDKDYYTTSSYSNLDELITNIEQALVGDIDLEQDTNDPSKFYVQVDYTFGEADDIVNALVVNTSLLSNLITEEESNYEDYEKEYTKESLDAYKEVINAKKEVLNQTNITVDDIKNGINDINNAKDNLVTQANKEELEKQLNEIYDFDEDKYTEASFKNLTDLLEEANALLNNPDAEQDDVDEMVEKLKDAREKLVEKKVKEEAKEEAKEEEKDTLVAPQTIDNIIKTFCFLSISIGVLGLIYYKTKKSNLF